MQPPVNFRHLYYFWVAAREGGIARAAQRLELAVQTVSAQVRGLEQELGCALFKPLGRGLELTPAGRAALALAEQIFQLGEQLPAAVREAAGREGGVLRVGIADSLPKLAVRQLLQPASSSSGVRLVCLEGAFETLLAELALHRLDVVLADRPAPANPSLKLSAHLLGKAPLAWYAHPRLLEGLAPLDFPHGLGQLPVLLPTAHSAVRARLDDWFARQGIQPRVAGEFEDSALLASFGEIGLGAFAAPQWPGDDLAQQRGLRVLGRCPDVVEHFYAISARRKLLHPAVRQLLGEAAGADASAG